MRSQASGGEVAALRAWVALSKRTPEDFVREERARLVRARKPEKLVEDAVHGMLPKTKMGEAMYRKLKVYAGPDHPHTAQNPSKLEVA